MFAEGFDVVDEFRTWEVVRGEVLGWEVLGEGLGWEALAAKRG